MYIYMINPEPDTHNLHSKGERVLAVDDAAGLLRESLLTAKYHAPGGSD